MRLTLVGNQTVLELPDGYPTVRAVEVCVYMPALACSSSLGIHVQRPDAGKGGVEVPHHRLGARLKCLVQAMLMSRQECRQPRSFRGFRLRDWLRCESLRLI